MRFISMRTVGLLVAFAGACPALAAEPDIPASFVTENEQDSLVPHVGFNIGAGVSFPLADSGKRFETGGAFQLGVTYNFNRLLGVQAEYLYSGYNIQSNVLDSTGVNGYHSMQYGDLNAVFNVIPARPFGIYVLGGPGIYHRRVEITEFAGVAAVPYCDPWLYICYTTPVSVESVLGARSRTDFGLNAGVGISLRLFGGPMRLYAEARYHYIFSGDIDTAAGPKKANGQYIPLVFGLRL
ncbi:outer membrane beta-barrel protein [Vitiosangium sp. GDMCC 1.1324]|uniref:outer membrane beta-barrel protein n=1 Tax=Vitiosangium sp. (strain GDMCC 1.1324) TaxID=2138576 RepID=UPI00130E07ED|nr:outer membrane beta-barrel protein [Vitiosangium sp. GDMCC 1.1324]